MRDKFRLFEKVLLCWANDKVYSDRFVILTCLVGLNALFVILSASEVSINLKCGFIPLRRGFFAFYRKLKMTKSLSYL